MPGSAMENRYSKHGVYAEGDFVSVRYDLMPEAHAPGGRDQPFDGKRQANAASAACKALRNHLEAIGYTVNRRRTPVYSLYVVELTAGCLGPFTRRIAGDLYVGQTSKTVSERIQDHLNGKVGREGKRAIHSSIVHKHFVRVRQDLVPVAFPAALFCQEQSLRAESLLRLCLERNGYLVRGGRERYDEMKAAVAGRDPIAALPGLLSPPASKEAVTRVLETSACCPA